MKRREHKQNELRKKSSWTLDRQEAARQDQNQLCLTLYLQGHTLKDIQKMLTMQYSQVKEVIDAYKKETQSPK